MHLLIQIDVMEFWLEKDSSMLIVSLSIMTFPTLNVQMMRLTCFARFSHSSRSDAFGSMGSKFWVYLYINSALFFFCQIAVDCPRTVPDVTFFQHAQIQKSLERILYTWLDFMANSVIQKRKRFLTLLVELPVLIIWTFFIVLM